MVQVRPDARLLHARLTGKTNHFAWNAGLHLKHRNKEDKIGLAGIHMVFLTCLLLVCALLCWSKAVKALALFEMLL